MTAYYNEIDGAAAHVLECLIADGVIAPGVVDRRSIRDVQPADLVGFTQCHFFAGGGLWSVAARLAGWPDDKPLWTGSCPCQGESLAGKRLGADDPRHLWPDFHRLIRARRPAVVVGEQVAAAAGTHWLDRVCADLADENYAFRAVDLPACSVDAPHQRQRLYWIAVDDDDDAGLEGQRRDGAGRSGRQAEAGPTAPADGELFVNPESERRGEGRPEHELWGGRNATAGADAFLQPDSDRGGRAGRQEGAQRRSIFGASAERAADGLRADAAQQQSERDLYRNGSSRARPSDADACPLPNGSNWSDHEWIVSPLDGKARRTKPGIPFLVNGLPGRVGLWRIGGNAIVPQVAAEVLKAYLDTERLF